jgi:hypothetical protein
VHPAIVAPARSSKIDVRFISLSFLFDLIRARVDRGISEKTIVAFSSPPSLLRSINRPLVSPLPIGPLAPIKIGFPPKAGSHHE